MSLNQVHDLPAVRAFYDEHPEIDLYTPAGDYKIQPIAGVYQSAEYWDFTFDFVLEDDLLYQIDAWKALSTFRSPTVYNAEDRFIVLTLCTYDIVIRICAGT